MFLRLVSIPSSSTTSGLVPQQLVRFTLLYSIAVGNTTGCAADPTDFSCLCGDMPFLQSVVVSTSGLHNNKLCLNGVLLHLPL
jgi:hypothetical protein